MNMCKSKNGTKCRRKSFYMVTLLSMFLMLSMLMVGCGGVDADKEKKTLVFADAGWDSIRIHNAIASNILSHGYGYDTEEIPGSEQVSLLGVRQGEIDIYMEIWTGNVIEEYTSYIDKGLITEVGLNYDDNMQGLYVPTYIIEGDAERGIEPMAPDLKSIDDLAKYWELFKDPEDPSKGRIYGSIPGWFADEVLQVKMETYGLKDHFNYFQPGSAAGLNTSLVSAINDGEPWVGYYWEPTWISGQYDLTLLEDAPYNEEDWADGFKTEFPSQRLTIAVQNDLPSEAPDVVEFLSNYKTSSAITAEALAMMDSEELTINETALWFLKEHEELWTQWVPNEVSKKVIEGTR